MTCHGHPIPDTIHQDADGRTRARCLCRRELVLIADVPERRDTWRHKPKPRVLR